MKSGGEGGIRTLGSLLDYGALAKLCFRPLSHLTSRRENCHLWAGSSMPRAAVASIQGMPRLGVENPGGDWSPRRPVSLRSARTLGSLLDYGALAKLCFRPLSHLTSRRENRHLWAGSSMPRAAVAALRGAQPCGWRNSKRMGRRGDLS